MMCVHMCVCVCVCARARARAHAPYYVGNDEMVNANVQQVKQERI